VRSAVDDAPAVLVCDDDRDLLDAVTVLLADAGLRAIVSDDASEAFRLAVHERPAAVLLDLNMPAPDGRDAFRNLLLHPETRDVPVVVLSCVPPEDEPDIAARAMSWVTKPADPATLLRVISAAVRKRPRPLVLVVEDDEPLVDVLAASLEGHGLVVTSAANASDAVALSKRLLPDVLLLDVTLLGSDGFDVVAALRADERLAEVPLVVYTGMDLDRAAKRRLTLGPTVFLTKARCTPGMVEGTC
jgi:CheY-like chemotaxis protein